MHADRHHIYMLETTATWWYFAEAQLTQLCTVAADWVVGDTVAPKYFVGHIFTCTSDAE